MSLKRVITIVALLISAAPAWGQSEAPPEMPNIIFIVSDDLGYGDLSCYGQKSFTTPNIDRLATSGLKFTRHYSGATVCSPSRCSLMTGRDGGHATIRGNGKHMIANDEVTVAEIAKAAGYRTAMIGKSCLTGNTQTPEKVLENGFDYFYGTTDHRDGHFRYPKFVYRNAERVGLPNNNLHSGTDYDGDLYTAEALSFIAKQSEQAPFFLVLSYPMPHASVIAPEKDLAEVRPFVKNEVEFEDSKHYTNSPEVLASYIAMLKIMDDAVGSVVEQLEEQSLVENTLIIFTSDNGPSFEGGKKPDMLDSNGPLRGGKRDLYEGGIRVPFIASWPAVIKPGRTTDHASAFWDFLPTVCDLAGQPKPDGIQGLSFAATLRGQKQTAHDYLYWEFHEKGGRRALQRGDWKLVQYNLNKPKQLRTELYNLADDIGEANDLSESHPELVSELLELTKNARVPSKFFKSKGMDMN